MRTDKIICPVDFSEGSKEAFRAAVSLAVDSGGALTLVHVYGLGAFAANRVAMSIPDGTEVARADAEKALAELRKEASAQGAQNVEIAAVQGVPWDQIVNVATTSKADLIVMGTHGRSGIARVLIGSVAEKVVRHAPCNVLVVRKR